MEIEPWYIIQTDYTLIKYKTRNDLARFNKAIKFGPSERQNTGQGIHITDSRSGELIAQKVDAVFMRAQEILDMKKRFSPVHIHLYSGPSDLNKAYESLYPGECNLRAWYSFKNNTVFLNVRDLHEGMLAHELAHAIIDHYMTVRPPSQTAEILARYVDSHLERGFAK
ncbi:MAG: hypothetical protein ABIJ31_10025 [Pseudomonadota bacterium]